MSKNQAFTIVELIIVMTIIGILIGIAVVNLPRGDIALRQAAQSFSLSVQRARSEAIKRNEIAGVTITAEKFSVFIDENQNKSFDVGEIIVSQVNMLTDYPSVSLVSNRSNDIVFDPRGFVANIISQSVTFSSFRSSSKYKAVISSQGRVRLEKSGL